MKTNATRLVWEQH